ncbi:response regulator [bacterium]|nr:response regulator [bacterium]
MASIIVVDDDDQVRVMLRQMLERIGHEVREASTGNEALKCYAEEPADLVIMDLIMPDKEGIETITEMRRKFPRVKIIAMSGGGRIGADNYLEIASKLGAQRTLSKPFNLEKIQQALNDLL